MHVNAVQTGGNKRQAFAVQGYKSAQTCVLQGHLRDNSASTASRIMLAHALSGRSGGGACQSAGSFIVCSMIMVVVMAHMHNHGGGGASTCVAALSCLRTEQGAWTASKVLLQKLCSQAYT